MGETISKDVIAELETALQKTELQPEAVDSIIKSLKVRRRRWLAVRSTSAVVAVAALCAVFYLGTMVGKQRAIQPVSKPEPHPVKKSSVQTETKPDALIMTEVSDTTAETPAAEDRFALKTNPETEKRVQDKPNSTDLKPIISEPVIPKPATTGSVAANKAAPSVLQKPQTKVDAPSLYAVELIGFSKPKESAELNKKLRREGYSSSLHKLETPNGTVLHRVWIGHFKTQEKALDFAGKLRLNEGLEGKVVKRTR